MSKFEPIALTQDDAINLFLEEKPYPIDDMYGCGFDQWDELHDFMEKKGYVFNESKDLFLET